MVITTRNKILKRLCTTGTDLLCNRGAAMGHVVSRSSSQAATFYVKSHCTSEFNEKSTMQALGIFIIQVCLGQEPSQIAGKLKT